MRWSTSYSCVLVFDAEIIDYYTRQKATSRVSCLKRQESHGDTSSRETGGERSDEVD
jgi:hypothetical protein